MGREIFANIHFVAQNINNFRKIWIFFVVFREQISKFEGKKIISQILFRPIN